MNIKKGPWIIKNSQNKYKNDWIEVREDEVVRPDGENGIFAVVNMKAGVTVLPLDNDDNVYLVKEYKYAVDREATEAISGGIEIQESKLESAKRELLEELGMEGEEWIDLGLIDPFTSVINSPNHIYLVRKLKFSNSELEGTEKLKVVKMALKEALEKVMSSEITHGASVAVILKTKNYLDSLK